MTCVAWDGESLAADKRACAGSSISTVTKIHRIGNKLVGYAGELVSGIQLVNWIRDGGEFPMAIAQDGEPPVQILLIADGLITVYENSPVPLVFEDPFFAIGSGRDYAIAAMHCGRTAAEAVEIASQYDADCGNGIDVLVMKRSRR